MVTRVHDELVRVQERIYVPCRFLYTEPVFDLESKEYGASKFRVNNLSVVFRVAKITPKKSGQFVTLWKRSSEGTIQPLDCSDPFDLVVISVSKGSNFGQFIFSKRVLSEKKILSNKEKKGKLAFRVYPPWDDDLNGSVKFSR